MAITLCGVQRSNGRVRLLGRHLILMPAEAFSHQSAGGLALDQAVQRHVLRLAARERLSQVDWHTHPGDGRGVGFSSTDDRSEQELAAYLSRKIPGTFYASVVMNGRAIAARMWESGNGQPAPVRVPPPDLENPLPPSREAAPVSLDARFDRQVRAFGLEFQRRLGSLKVGLVGLGGLGSILAEQLARLGVRDWVLVDPDEVDGSSLNRLVGATARDVEEEVAKVHVAARNIRRIEPKATIKAFACSAFAPRALRQLKGCDLLIAATDNDASRLALNALACQYLIPLVHVGVNLQVKGDGGFEDISGEFAIPPLGTWCLLCAGIIDSQRAAWDLARPEERALLVERGYLPGTPAPAVYHLNGVVASLAAAEIHNIIYPYKPLRRYLVYRELEGELMALEVPRREGCLHCGPEGLLGLGDLTPIWRLRPGRNSLPSGLPSADSGDMDEGREAPFSPGRTQDTQRI
jgi:hypothetical protein